MAIRKTQIGWMTLGGLICLSAVALTFQLRDGNRAVAQGEPETTEQSDPAPAMPEAPREEPPPPIPGTPLPPLTEEASEPTDPVEPPAPLPEEPPAPPVASPPAPPAPEPEPEPPPMPDTTTAEPPRAPEPFPAARATHNVTEVGAAPATPPQATPPVYSALPPRAPVPVETEPVPPLTRVGALVPAPSPAPLPGPTYRVRKDGETLEEVAQKTLGSSKRWLDIHRLNPGVGQEGSLLAGMMLHLPADARIVGDEPIKPLPSLHPDRPHSKPRVVLPLTGTYLCEVDEHQVLHLPRALREQLTNPETVLVSPGPDKCLWLTDQTHLERLGKRLEESSAPENEVRIFKRLYFAQIEKLPVNTGGRVVISRRMATFAGLSRKVVLVGIGDHFEVWDEARWRVYTKEQSENTQARLAN